LLIWLFTVGAKFPASALTEQEVKAYREIESEDMHKTLDIYLAICQKMGVFVVVCHNYFHAIDLQHSFQNLFE